MLAFPLVMTTVLGVAALSETCGSWGNQPCAAGQDRHPDPLPAEPYPDGVRFAVPAGMFAPVQKNTDVLGFSSLLLPPHECGRALCENLTDPACHSHGAEFDKSIQEVLSDHHGILGSCHFHYLADISYLGRTPDYPLESLYAWLRREKTAGAAPREVTYNWEGAPLLSKLEDPSHALGDLLSFAMGWLQGQAGVDTSLMADSAAWEAQAASQCAAVRQTHGFDDGSTLSVTTVLGHLRTMDLRARCATGAEASEGDECAIVTVKDLARIFHHYCVLGLQSAAQTIAKYHSRACLLKGNRVGHLKECVSD